MPNYNISFPIKGEGSKKTTVTAFITAADASALDTRVTALMVAVNGMTTGVITPVYKSTEVRAVAPSGIRTTPAAGSAIGKKAKFGFRDALGNPKLLTVPTFDDIAFGGTEGNVNIELTAVEALIDEIIDNGYTTSQWGDLTTLESAKEAFEG